MERNLRKWAAVMGARGLGAREHVDSFEVDSRKVRPGALFFALKGEKTDGHLHLKEVISKGAVGAVVSEGFSGDYGDFPLLHVPDVLMALQACAEEVMRCSTCQVIGVTGSVGKTTTKEWIAQLLAEKYRVARTQGNANSQVGFPLEILNQGMDVDVFVAEMGMSRPGELSRLVQIAPPDIAVITKVALAHAASFPDGLEGIAAAKAEILTHPKTRIALINQGASQFCSVMHTGSAVKEVYGVATRGVDWNLRVQPEGVVIEGKGEESGYFSLPFQAAYLQENFLAAAVVAHRVGMRFDEIARAAQHLRQPQMRFEKVDRGGILIINDAYNANPASMRAALTHLPRPKKDARTIAVLGEMRELGPFSEAAHLEIGELALQCIDHLICYGSGCQPMVDLFTQKGRPVAFFHDLEALKCYLFGMARAGDVVLLKGSNGNQLWRLLD